MTRESAHSKSWALGLLLAAIPAVSHGQRLTGYALSSASTDQATATRWAVEGRSADGVWKTVGVTGCEPIALVGPPNIDGFRCSIESAYLAKLVELGYGVFEEGFEDDGVWGSARAPDTQSSISSQGIDWEPNTVSSGITTGLRARTGLWGALELPHGITTGLATDSQRDGFVGTWTGVDGLFAVGVWLNSNTGGAKTRFAIDGIEVSFADSTLTALDRFFGVIDTTGFSSFEIFETEGVVGDQENIFADDFTFATTGQLIFADGFESGSPSAWSSTLP